MMKKNCQFEKSIPEVTKYFLVRLMIVHILLVRLDVLFLGLELPLMRC